MIVKRMVEANYCTACRAIWIQRDNTRIIRCPNKLCRKTKDFVPLKENANGGEAKNTA